ncbi:MAG: DNA polymerase III subunit gamma/tau [Gammaproteobacteria bacterium]|nr:MAG: DNA polymerase III subunit gamma/tau [Gammaproteobacteria bacterium]
MTYQVLARKWRPRLFSELVGQEHVQRALINALDNDRLHHAYLFTGTRGVGKTTIARILAKSLNCEAGVSSTPCGSCDSCIEIDEGRFVDLIEVDAASRTKVEDTRELLENVQYAPTRGRYKVYLVDEVHMLSGHSFNALLKTLEEPPPHVKFLLATTDPQKLPVTILSRCLQFNLKHLSVTQISRQLAEILDKEQIGFEEGAVRQLAIAADGSMRDALSLLDQAIGFGGGELRETEVRTMLGTIDRDTVYRLLQDLAAADAAALLTEVGKVDEFAPDYAALLADMLTVLQRVAIAQALPDAIDDTFGDRDAVIRLAGELAPEDVQLYYQIGLLGRRDLSMAPDARGGFEMVMLRMLAFRPGTEGQDTAVETRINNQSAPPVGQADNKVKTAPAPVSKAAGEWQHIIEQLGINGLAREMALNCALQEVTETSVVLTMEKMHTHLLNKSRTDQVEAALRKYYGRSIKLKILKDVQSVCESPARQKAREEDERRQQAVEAIEADSNIKAMQDTFGATISYESIRPRD